MSDAVTILDIDEIFQRYIDSKQKVWKHDRSQSLGASETFDCIRKQAFNKRGKEWGIEPDEDYDEDFGAMERGNIIEDHYVVPALSSQLPALGIDLLFAGQANQETLVKGRSSATPDGLLTGIPKGKVVIKTKDKTYELDVQEGCIGLEVKSIDPRATLNEERKKHHGQTQMGLGLMRELTEWAPRYWIILYIDASFLSKIKPFVVEFDPDIYAAGKKRAERIWQFKSAQDAPPEGKFDGSCEHCKFKQACGHATIASWDNATRTIEGADAILIAPFAQEYLQKKDAAEKAAEDFEQSKQQLKEALQAANARKVVGDDYRVTLTLTKGRKILDQTALRASGINLEPFMKTGAGFETLKVTPKKDED